MKTVGCTLVAGCVLTGCGYLTPPMEHPSFEQHVQDRVNTFGVIPSRRMMIFKRGDPLDPKSEEKIIVCAEAPADVTDNLASTFAASLAVSGTQGVDASGAISKTLQTFGQSLFKRTQGVQLFRDRSYYLCQARMNGFIDDATYIKELNNAFTLSIKLVEIELRNPQKRETDEKPNLEEKQTVIPPGSQNIIINPPQATASTSRTKAEAGKGGAESEAGNANTKVKK